MANIIIQGGASGTGSTTITGPSTNNTNTVTLPDTTGGSIQVSSNMPAFSAYVSSAVSFTNGVYTKVTFQTKEFDTANAYDNTTNYRFQPLVAGYYQINASIYWGNAGSSARIDIYKNGSVYKIGVSTINSSSVDITTTANSIVYLNGSTDYIEIYGLQTSGGTITTQGTTLAYSYFNGVMVRAA